MNEDDLAQLLRTRKSGRSRPWWRCLDEATLAALADGTLSDNASVRARRHLADCDFCLEHVAAAVRSHEATLSEAPASLLAQARGLVRSQDAESPSRTRNWRTAAAAASLVLVASFLVWQSRTRELEPHSPEVRTAAGQLMSPELLFPQEGSIVELRWREVPEALFYEVQLLTAEGDVLWQGRFEETHARLPEMASPGAGQEVFVWVRAHVLDGKTLTSAPVGFRIEDTP